MRFTKVSGEGGCNQYRNDKPTVVADNVDSEDPAKSDLWFHHSPCCDPESVMEASRVRVAHDSQFRKAKCLAMFYSQKESSLGSGRDDGASLAGKESAIVLSSIFSRFA